MATAIPLGSEFRNMSHNMSNVLGMIDSINNSLKDTSKMLRVAFDSNNVKKMHTEFSSVSTQISGISDRINESIIRQQKSNSIWNMMKRNAKAYVASGEGLRELVNFYRGAVSGANEQVNAEHRVATAMKQKMSVSDQEINKIKNLAREQEKLGVISDEVQMSGIAQLTNYVGSSNSLDTLLPAMNNLAVNKDGVNTNSESIAGIGDIVGQAMTGDLSGIENTGVMFSEAQKNIMLFGNEEEKAIALSEAINSSVGDMNALMAQMPEGKIKQVNDTWSSMKENIGMQLYPAVLSFFDILNNNLPTIAPIFSAITAGVGIVVEAFGGIIDVIGNIVSFVADNWEIIAPILLGVIAIISILAIALNTATIAVKVHSAVVKIAGAVTKAWSIIQTVFNAIMALNPIFLIILAVIALITVIFVVVAVMNKFTGSTLTGLGIICGAVAAVAAVIWNIVAGVINSIMQFLWSFFVEPFIGIIEWILNVFNGGFDSFGDAIKNLIGNIISWFLSLGTVVTKIIDAIFGTNWTGGLNELKGKVLQWGKNEDAITLDKNMPFEIGRIDVTNAWDKGNDFGDGIQNKLGDLAKGFGSGSTDDIINKYIKGDNKLVSGDSYDYSSLYNDIGNTGGYGNLGSLSDSSAATAANTGKIAENTEKTSELLDIVNGNKEKEIIARFTSSTNSVTIDMSGMSNTYNNTADAFDAAKELQNYLNSKMAISVDGV